MTSSISTGFTVEDGVGVQDARAPQYRELRPLTVAKGDDPVQHSVFPVYPDLVERLLTPLTPLIPGNPYPDHTVAHTLATCSGYAYSDAHTLSTMMARMGLANNRCRMINMQVDAMLITSTAFLVQSEDGKVVILGYRGTDPTNVITLLGDLDIYQHGVGIPIGGKTYAAHAGFYRNTRATRFKVVEALLRAQQGYPVTRFDDEKDQKLAPMEALYLTGHSLGAAMAAIQSVLLRTDPGQGFTDQLAGTYTFAQPMIGSPELAEVCNEDEYLRERVLRFVYRKDPVPHFPSRSTGNFANFGREFHYGGHRWRDTTGSSAQQSQLMVQLIGATLASVARQFPLLRELPVEYQFSDHIPLNYITSLTPPGVPTEFGDYTYSA